MRKTVLPWLACALIAVIAIPTLAWGEQARDPQPVANARVPSSATTSSRTTPGARTTTRSRSRRARRSRSPPRSAPDNSGVHNVDFDPGDAAVPRVHQTDDARGLGPRRGRQAADAGLRRRPRAGRASASSTHPAPTRSSARPTAGWTGEVDRDRDGDADADRDGDGDRHADGHRHADAPPTGPTITAHDSGANYWFQDASSSSTSDNSVTVKAGDRVTFNFPVARARACTT